VFDWDIFRQSIRIGLPTGFQQTFVALGMMALMGIVNTFGTDVIAGYTAAGRIDSIAGLPAMSISMALSVFVGQNLGAGKIERIRAGLRAALLIGSITSIATTIAVWLWGDPIMKIFTNDANVIAVGKEYLIIVSLFYIVFSTMFTFTGLLRGAGATLIPMFITLFSLWLIRIPLAWFLSKQIGVQGIWWSIPIAWFSGMIFLFIYYKMGHWKNKAVVKSVVVAGE
jgi:putative MATE family efflux protein